MRLSEVFDYLSQGELAHLDLGGNTSGDIDTDNYTKVITNLNLALAELHKRFPVKVRELVLRQQDHIAEYNLNAKHAVTNPYGTDDSQYPKYIDDSAYSPFTDDILIIEAVFNELGEEVPLNDENKIWSVFTTSPTTLAIPYPDSNNALFIQYRAAPVKIPTTVVDPSTVEIDLPVQYAEALLNYVAHRIFSSMNMNSPEATNYYSKFEASCKMLENTGMTQRSNPTNMRLENNGWL